MIEDLNKTPLTHQVTKRVALWLCERGFKPVETEVQMPLRTDGPGWIADLAAFIFPTQTELVDLKLLRRPPRLRYSSDPQSSSFFTGDLEDDRYKAWAEARDHLCRLMSCLVEVKTSRADFLGDRKWDMTRPTNLAYLACVPGIVRPDEWPKGWGILEVQGDKVRQLRPAEMNPTTEGANDHFSILYSLAIRRDHRTRYRLEREWRQRARMQEAQERRRDIIHAVLNIARARRADFNLELAWTGLRAERLRPAELEALRELWELGRATTARVSQPEM